MTITPEYASAIVRRFFDARGPLAPLQRRAARYVVMQRINLGLYAVLGSLNATANWRRIAEEIWPFVHGPALDSDRRGGGPLGKGDLPAPGLNKPADPATRPVGMPLRP